MINFHYLFLFAVILTSQTLSQNKINKSRLQSNFAKSENKQKYYSNLVKNTERTFSQKYSGNWNEWIRALRDAQSIFLKSANIEDGLRTILSLEVDKNKKLQRVALEVAHTLYKNSLENEIERIWRTTKDEISFAIAVYYLLNKYDNDQFLKSINDKFGEKPEDQVIQFLKSDLEKLDIIKPDLTELLNHNFHDGKTIIFSIHRKNRKYPGLTILRKPDGEFVKNSEGELFHIPQLALSYSNLPSYLPNGNTPQGIYSIQGIYISPTETIGPTPNVLSRIPYEISPDLFYHNSRAMKKWDIQDYQNLLPESWQDYDPIYDSFYAGKIGRRLIIIHGSTDEIDYFSGEPYYPLTPTRGCLSSTEIWDGKNGKSLKSDQLNLTNELKSVGQLKGYLVVVEIDDKDKPLEISEISRFIK